MSQRATNARAPSTMSYGFGVALVLSAGVCWSFMPLGIKYFEHASAWQILLYRSLGVLPLVVWLIHRLAEDNAVNAVRASGLAGVIGALGLMAAYSGAVGAVRLTTIANAAFIFATAPFFAALLARFVLKESLRSFTIVAMILATCGIALMVYGGISRGNWLGNLLALISAMGFAVFTVALRAAHSANSLPVVFLGTTFTLVLACVMIAITGDSYTIVLAEALLALGLGACLLGVGMVLYAYGSGVVPAGELALLCMTEVIFAPVWGWLFLHEYPVGTVLIGGSIVVIAIVLNAITGMRNKPRPFPF